MWHDIIDGNDVAWHGPSGNLAVIECEYFVACRGRVGFKGNDDQRPLVDRH